MERRDHKPGIGFSRSPHMPEKRGSPVSPAGCCVKVRDMALKYIGDKNV